MKQHIETEHLGIRYDCDECDYQNKTRKFIKRHKLVKHRGIKPVSCNLCNEKGISTKWLNMHNIQKHGAEYVLCDYCPFKSHTKLGMKCHLNKNHEGAWLYKQEVIALLPSSYFE